MDDVRDLHRVRDDREVRHVHEMVREPPCRRAGGQPDRQPGLDELGRGACDRLLLAELPVRLRLEARLVRAERSAERRTA